MSRVNLSPLQRVLLAMGHEEPDRVPLFLPLTMHGARELGITLREYYSKPRHVADGRLRLFTRYGHDFLYAFFYAALELEAWGAETLFRDDGPPNCAEPIIKKTQDIKTLNPPRVADSPCLLKVLETIEILKSRVGTHVPIVGVAISPFSLPPMQMGFDAYMDLIYERPDLFWRLMKINKIFCIDWANAQLAAGATAICYFDPVSSPSLIPRELYLKTGFVVARDVLPAVKGLTATHLASGRTLPIMDDLARTGTSMVGVSCVEDLGDLKRAASGKLTLVGNLNGVEMRRWTPEKAEAEVKSAIARAARGGGFILGDNHGEIPLQVGDEVLFAISEAVRSWGRYPLDWIEDEK